MSLSQFDITKMLQCSDTDPEGFRCLRQPAHDGEHKWSRCESVDSEGHRCALQPGHGGRHYQPWYDRHATVGDTHSISYGGTEKETSRLADRAAAIAAGYGWVDRSREFTPGFLWRWPPTARWLAGLASPGGRFTIEFEFRGKDEQTPD